MTDLSAYHRLVETVDTPAVIVTAVADGPPAGCLVTFNTPCSVDPPRYAVWLSHRNHTYDVACRTGTLTVHLLARADLPLAEHFASVSGHDVDKFAGWRWRRTGDAVVLAVAGGWFTGTVQTRVPTGDHTAFVLAPTEAAGAVEGTPLVTADVRQVPPGRGP